MARTGEEEEAVVGRITIREVNALCPAHTRDEQMKQKVRKKEGRERGEKIGMDKRK